jgi:ABC-type nitrate/sulfonate/bicarbonate transport system substrate-binding protein
VKKIRITFRARVLLIIVFALALWLVESFTGAFHMKGSDLLLTTEIIENADKPFAITIGALDVSSIAGIVSANGGLETGTNSHFAKNKLSVSITLFPDRVSMERAFSRGKVNIIAESPSVFAADAPSLEKTTPVAFLLCGADTAKSALFSKKEISSVSDMAGKTIACGASSSSFFFARMITDAGNATEQVKWILTVTDNESLALFKNGKADIIAIDMSAGITPEGTVPFLSYRDMRSPLSSVLIARESDIALHKDALALFTSAYFEHRKYLLSQKDANVKDMFTALKVTLPEGAHPAKFIASESENFLFFRLTALRSWDFFSQYYAAMNGGKVLKKIDALKPAVSINTSVITSAIKIDAIKPDNFPAPVSAQRKTDFSLYSKAFTYYKDNSDIDRKSASDFKIISQLYGLCPQSQINVSLGGDSQDERNQFYQREIAIRSLLTRYNIPSQAVTVIKGKEPRLSLIIPSSVKK